MIQLTPIQQTILDVVCRYPGRFSRSGLAKMLVGAKSWQDVDFPDYGRFSTHRRKDIACQIDILQQQGFLMLDSQAHLATPS
ncbi:MAG: hypothetical protein IPM39_27850 [Chloroflexi bacterium]|nr:hypothetical protein [Chloroflexota bacterium]